MNDAFRFLSTQPGRAPVRSGAAFSAAFTAATIVFLIALPVAIAADHARGGHTVRESGSAASGVNRTLLFFGTRIGYADGAPAGFSGGFGEQSCHGCHFSAEPNTPPGQATIDGVPGRFTPGEQYPITIALQRPGMKLGGFQLAARFTDGGAQAGSLEGRPQDGERVKFDTQGGIQYASQTRAGAAVSEPGVARWTVVWTAPADARPVQFHVSANAADGDESAEGDYVYTATAGVAPAER